MLRNELMERIKNHRTLFIDALEARLNERWKSDENPAHQYVDEADQYRVRSEFDDQHIDSIWVSRRENKGYVSTTLSRFEDGETPLNFNYDLSIVAPHTFSEICYKGANNLFAEMPQMSEFKRTKLPFEDADDAQHEKNLARAKELMSNVDVVIGELNSRQYVKTAYASSGRLGVFHQIIPYKLHVEFDAKCLEEI